MANQLDQALLFPIDWGAVEGPAPIDTRREARRAVAPQLQTLQREVLLFLARRGEYGATDEEIREALHFRADTSRARRCELRDLGLIVDSGQTRPGRSGRAMTVWRLAPGIITAAEL